MKPLRIFTDSTEKPRPAKRIRSCLVAEWPDGALVVYRWVKSRETKDDQPRSPPRRQCPLCPSTCTKSLQGWQDQGDPGPARRPGPICGSGATRSRLPLPTFARNIQESQAPLDLDPAAGLSGVWHVVTVEVSWDHKTQLRDPRRSVGHIVLRQAAAAVCSSLFACWLLRSGRTALVRPHAKQASP